MVDKAEARHEISKLIYGYSEALDGGDLEEVARILEHCTLRVPQNDIEARGPTEIKKMFEDFTAFYRGEEPAGPYEDGSHPHTCHFVANLVIDVDDDGLHAKSRSYVIVFQARPGFELRPIFRNRYHDQFACVDGRWRFTERVEILDEFQGDVTHHLLQSVNTA